LNPAFQILAKKRLAPLKEPAESTKRSNAHRIDGPTLMVAFEIKGDALKYLRGLGIVLEPSRRWRIASHELI